MNPINQVFETFARRGEESYADEPVTQLEHALQCAALAEEAGSPPSLVAAALLHDLGHIMADAALPGSLAENLHDQHEERAYAWLQQHFGLAVAEPVRLHVAAKRYLCTTEPGYEQRLSPTSVKSFYDQGGKMSADEVTQFEAEPQFEAALQLRQWDDQAKLPDWQGPGLGHYRPLLGALVK